MSYQIIFIYCLCDELLNAIGHREDHQTKMYDAEILTFAITAALFFQGNYKKTKLFFDSHRYFGRLLGRSRLNKRLLRIPQEIWLHIFTICHVTLCDKNNREYIVDSFPVPVCQNARITRCKLLRGKEYRGFCSSKNIYFFGLKAHVLTTADGIPLEVVFTSGSEADVKAFRRFNLDLEEGSVIYADKAYTDYTYEDLLSDVGITLCAHRKRNARRQHTRQRAALQKYRRKRIETSFSGIALLMPRCIHAVTMQGFELKLFLFILGFSLQHLLP